ncbi:hypothetical protein MPNT_190018 [Candidatus Methylacidithermus pantelleriae]|uniref:Uncharacterized protein n=1 Tax=Candidatus Methylacidithermus pantelleriae TaxID=2744239 RepID=A0A8J2BHM1_9BACT|nr:hypothetical protein MPNT_190018 [Candidatus Methylacidithermus pantelleriae]
MRFGFEYREAAWAIQSRSILLVDPNEITDHCGARIPWGHRFIVCRALREEIRAEPHAKKAFEAFVQESTLFSLTRRGGG